MKGTYEQESARCVREGFWDERIICDSGYCVFAFGFFTRRILRAMHGRDTILPIRAYRKNG
jgi:hypothetical protein